MAENRLTQEPIEVLTGIPSARLSQESLEVLTGNPKAIVTQVAIEVITSVVPVVTQMPIEVIVANDAVLDIISESSDTDTLYYRRYLQDVRRTQE